MIELRPTRPEDRRQAAGAFAAALLHAPPDDEAWEKSAASWEATASFSAWDDGRCVGHVGAYPVATEVPGGAWLPTGAVTRVGILPTHRRRGIATDLMTMMLRDARDQGQALASLRASEAVIYGRYGFGMAGWFQEIELTSARARPLRGVARGGTFRILAPDEILPTVEAIYERSTFSSGRLRRPEWMWKRYLDDALQLGGDAKFVVVHADEHGFDDGYALYDVKWTSNDFGANHGVGFVDEIWATSPAVELAMWDYLVHLDLVRSWKAEERPIDDLVRTACHDVRAYEVKGVWDEQWLRIVDVDAALTARAYRPVHDEVTIRVTDPLFPDNDGTWHITAAGARRLPGGDDDGAELVMDVRSLATVYLGNPAWHQLHTIGDITTHEAPDGAASDGPTAAASQALDAATALFATDRAPFCGSFF